MIATVYDRLLLAPGAKIDGPAIITESDTVTVITRRFEGQVVDWRLHGLSKERNPSS